MEAEASIIGPNEPVLITGAGGFIGLRVVESLLRHGFRNLRCFARPSSNSARMEALAEQWKEKAAVEIVKGNLLSREDCLSATGGVAVIYHLAAGRGEKLYADAFMNSVVTTRNLLEASMRHGCMKRFVSISSFSVYSNIEKPNGRLLDESCPLESHPELRGDAYSFAKVKQDELVSDYGHKFGIP